MGDSMYLLLLNSGALQVVDVGRRRVGVRVGIAAAVENGVVVFGSRVVVEVDVVEAGGKMLVRVWV
jgi:hypothetical protein